MQELMKKFSSNGLTGISKFKYGVPVNTIEISHENNKKNWKSGDTVQLYLRCTRTWANFQKENK